MQKQPFLPYMGLEFHLCESIKSQRTEPGQSQAHFDASSLFTEAQKEVDLDKKKVKIQSYKSFCKKNKIKAFSIETVKVGV